MNNKKQNVEIRPIKLSDIDAVRDLHKRVSAKSMQYRYLGGGVPKAAHFELVCRSGVGFVASDGQTIVGVAYYILENKFSAEIAFLIEDNYQRCGLGWQFFEKLIAAAKAANLHSLAAYVCSGNRGMIRLVEKSNLPYEHFISCGTREFTIRLAPNPVSATIPEDMIEVPDFIQMPALPNPIALCASLWRTLRAPQTRPSVNPQPA